MLIKRVSNTSSNNHNFRSFKVAVTNYDNNWTALPTNLPSPFHICRCPTRRWTLCAARPAPPPPPSQCTP